VIVYLTGPSTEDLDSLHFVLDQQGIGVVVRRPETSPEEAYEALMACDAVLLIHGGPKEELTELAAELGIAITLGRLVYAVRNIYGMPSRFLAMPGVRTFPEAAEALEALLADMPKEEVPDVELEGLGSGDPEAGGDTGDVP